MDPITAADLNRAVNDNWPHGEVVSVREQIRIGEDFGFGGAVHRLSIDTTTGLASLIAKKETHEQVERVVAAYAQMKNRLEGRVPVLYGHTDTVTFFEDVSPAVQGDGLQVRPDQVTKMMELLAELHASTRTETGAGWAPEPWPDSQWNDRVAVARHRYADHVDDGSLVRLARLHLEIPAAVETLRSEPQALIHMDSGYDNTLWRPDGSIVLLDWSNARVGTWGYDLAPHIVEADPAQVLTTYSRASQNLGIHIDHNVLVEQVAAGARILARGLVGFAGSPEEPAQPRLRRFRDQALRQVRTLLDLVDGL